MLSDSSTQTIVVEQLGGVRTVVTANPDNVEHIVKTWLENYPDGDTWKLQRKVASYEFNTHSIRNFVLRVVETVTLRLCHF